MDEVTQAQHSTNGLYMLVCTVLLPFVILGIGFFYSGLTQRRSSMSMLAIPLISLSLVFLDWFIWGYSLSYSTSSNGFIGNLHFAVLSHLKDETENLFYSTIRGDVYTINHFLFTGLFKAICAAITFPGCIAERGRLMPMLVFMFFWSCIIYNPVTYWFWNRNGWLSIELNLFPVLDFAGGSCIHIVGGFTAFAYSYILGPRNPKILTEYRGSNTGFIIIGTFLITYGWLGFMSGSGFVFSTYSLSIAVNTILSASSGGVVWAVIDYYFSAQPLEGINEHQEFREKSHKLTATISRSSRNIHKTDLESISNSYARRKFSMISFSSGIIAGLVVFTPGGGFVGSPNEFWKSILFGVIGAIACNISTRLKYVFGIDDALDIFAIHGVAGIIGSLLTGIFANKEYGSLGGWIEHHWVQLGYQILGCVVTAAYTFVISCVLLYIIDLIPGLHLRIDKTYNKRIRKQKHMENSIELESKLSSTQPHSFESGHIDVGENLELLGTDYYEFGEFTNDYVEFIKVIRPEDFVLEQEISGTEVENSHQTLDMSAFLKNRPSHSKRE